MRKRPDNRVWQKPSHWRRASFLAAAGMLSLAGCSTLDSKTTASAPDPFLGPGAAPPPKIASTTVQPPPGVPAPNYVGVLPAAAAPNPTVSLAALAPVSVHPTDDRADLRIGSPNTLNGQGWTPTGATAVASTASQATLNPPDTTGTPTRTSAPTVLTQNSNPPPTAQPVPWPPPPVPQAAPSAPVQAAQDPPQPSILDQPTTIEAATAVLKAKGALWQRPDLNSQTGEWLFRCGIANPKTNTIHTYEGRAKDQLSAMQAALDQINQGQ